MAETNQISFGFKEVVEALLKQHDIHEGTWAIYFKFGLKAANIRAGDDDLRPTAMLPVLEIGLQKAEGENNLAVDASRVNPRKRIAPKPKIRMKKVHHPSRA